MRRFLTFFLVMCIAPASVFAAEDRCVVAPVLMYHHVVDEKIGRMKGYGSSFVDTNIFRKQMEELRSQGFEVLPLNDLSRFFDEGIQLPQKSAFLTFDDGNKNIMQNAVPILMEFGYPATMFVVPRQMSHSLYVSIEDAMQLHTQRISIANHSYSHAPFSKLGMRAMREEILRADLFLTQHRLNSEKVFAFPYGIVTKQAKKDLPDFGYKLAFAASGGTSLCKSERYALPRIPVRNASLFKQGIQ